MLEFLKSPSVWAPWLIWGVAILALWPLVGWVWAWATASGLFYGSYAVAAVRWLHGRWAESKA